MKILFIIHECHSPYNVFPYGTGYLAAIAKRAGHQVVIYDQATNHTSNEKF